MEMKMMILVMGALLLQCASAQTLHVVGDELGWTILQGGADAYANWAASQRFMVDDILMFNFTSNDHDVLEVPKSSFDACTGSNPIGNVITTGPANITLVSPGQKYYICTFSQHCQLGQKLAITVSSAGASPPLATPTTPPAAPSPNSGVPVDCVPEPASSPRSGGPPPAGSGSSSSSSGYGVVAGFLLPVVSIAIALFV